MDLSSEELNLIISTITDALSQNVDIFLFGSRVDETSHKASDLDVLLKCKGPIDLSKISLIKEGFENSNLPFKVDLHDYHRSSKNMLENISSTLKKVH